MVRILISLLLLFMIIGCHRGNTAGAELGSPSVVGTAGTPEGADLLPPGSTEQSSGSDSSRPTDEDNEPVIGYDVRPTQLSFSQNSAHFGIPLESGTVVRKVQVKNVGNHKAFDVRVVGPIGSILQTASDCASTLDVGESCEITVEYLGLASSTTIYPVLDRLVQVHWLNGLDRLGGSAIYLPVLGYSNPGPMNNKRFERTQLTFDNEKGLLNINFKVLRKNLRGKSGVLIVEFLGRVSIQRQRLSLKKRLRIQVQLTTEEREKLRELRAANTEVKAKVLVGVEIEFPTHTSVNYSYVRAPRIR